MINFSYETKIVEKRLKTLIKRFPVDLSAEVNNGARAIVEDMKDRIGKGIDINGSKFTPLSENTVASKKFMKMKRPRSPLIGTGKMSGAMKELTKGAYLKKPATANDPVAIISAPNIKAPYGKYHQTGVKTRVIVPKKKTKLTFMTADGWRSAKSVKVTLPQRKWFGVSKDAEKKVNRFMNKLINRLVLAK